MHVVRPEIAVLTLENGETLIVKKRLNAGERREMYRAARGPDGKTIDGQLLAQSTILAFLLDWTVTDDISGEPLVIKGLSPDALLRTLNGLEYEDFREIYKAIDEHDDRMIAERLQEKKRRAGKPTSASDSPSPPDLVSATTMSTS